MSDQPSQRPTISLVLPIRNRQTEITRRVEGLLDALSSLSLAGLEIILVDDGSRDATLSTIQQLSNRFTEVIVIAHPRPRGLEAAGQTGLERSTGELVFIQECDQAPSVVGLESLLAISKDSTVLAARCESGPEPIAPSLLRRLRSSGTDADERIVVAAKHGPKNAMQMIRRRHLQTLQAPKMNGITLRGTTQRASSLVPM